VYVQTGLKITTQSFRHIDVKLMLEANPTNYEGPRQFLGHTSVATTTTYYAGEERSSHIRLFNGLIEKARATAVPLNPRSRPRSTSASRRRSESPA
jgi:integrase